MIRKSLQLAVFALSLLAAPMAWADAGAVMRDALARADQGDWEGALNRARDAGHLGFDIIEWQRLRAGEGTFGDYADFAARRAAWPGMELLRKKGEATLAGQSADAVIAYFGGAAPQTGAGALALVDALVVNGRSADAARVAEAAWRGLELGAADQAAFIERHGALIAPHHGGRMQAMLEAGETAQAKRMLDHVAAPTRAVAEARIALQERSVGVDIALAAVPEDMVAASYGLALDRATWRWRKSLEDGAADIILERSSSAKTLGAPALWADLRIKMVRFDLRAGNHARAYQLAAGHHLAANARDYTELEFLAGFAAMKAGDAARARDHFRSMAKGATVPATDARAQYWIGRASAALGDAATAEAAYKGAAFRRGTFYGFLAQDELGAPHPDYFARDPVLPDWRGRSFVESPVFAAAVLLHAAGADLLAERFILHLDEDLSHEDGLALIGLARDWGDLHLGLTLAKRTAIGGPDVMAALYPVPALDARDFSVPKALALSIARQESEFDPRAVSYVGARGLMQLMPETAKMMARKTGQDYALARLTEDPDYNVSLGTAYLAGLRDEFGASPVLVAAGYNAGPGRPRRWITEWGDPREKGADVAAWVEMIPFDETRGYVMRVSEAMPIYQQRLGKPPARFIDLLQGR